MKSSPEKELIEVWSRKRLDEEDVLWQHERKIMPKLIPIAKSCERILEVGAGEGRMARVLQKFGVSADFYSVDITPKVKLAPGHRLISDACALPFKDNAFDLVYSIGVVEHFTETAEAIKEHARVTKEGGCVFVMTPHFSPLGVYKRMRFPVGKMMKGWPGSFVSYVGKHLTRSQMRSYFNEAGLNIFYLEAHPPVTPLRESLDPFFWRLLPPAKFGGFLYCLATK